MKIEAPFHGIRKQTLYRYYDVTPKYEPTFDVTGAMLRRLFFWGVLLAVGMWFLWPSK
jgi:hypothetical protein